MELHEKAKRLLSSGRLEESCQLLTTFLDGYRDSAELGSAVTEAYNSRGQVKYLSVDFPGAVSDYSRALERDPSFAVAWYNRGQVRYRLGKPGLCQTGRTSPPAHSLLQAGTRRQRGTCREL